MSKQTRNAVKRAERHGVRAVLYALRKGVMSIESVALRLMKRRTK